MCCYTGRYNQYGKWLFPIDKRGAGWIAAEPEKKIVILAQMEFMQRITTISVVIILLTPLTPAIMALLLQAV